MFLDLAISVISVANFITFDSEGHVSWHLYTRDCDPISMLRHTKISYNVLEEVFRLSHDLEKSGSVSILAESALF